uniref:PPM-type phosphatase domain-containing protein n=1 Tax=Lotharella oceanica TaxID=641309 RepID=A0A7S2XAZ7_9EUKA|mmetsp:Transcript_26089/g.48642  ORF Transcript_26089/g.48642 Transcript_26089/m.48642 type:complete len:417 (+) Transcript_26089:1-1251(+)
MRKARLAFAAAAGALGTVKVGNAAVEEAVSIKDPIGLNKQTIRVERGLIKEVHTNWYPANNPIEDTHDMRLRLRKSPGSLFGVFDGHSGTAASGFCRDDLFNILEFKHQKALANKRRTKEATEPPLLNPPVFKEADDAFLQVALAERRFIDGNAGACAVVCHLAGTNLTTAWAGDCRAILGKKPFLHSILGGGLTADELTLDHQIDSNPAEKHRLVTEHPNEPDVLYRNRVKGRLEPTRAFGDGKYKMMEYFNFYPRLTQRYSQSGWTPPYVTAVPDVSHRTINSSTEFLVLACDGLFQDLTSQEVVESVGEYLQAAKEQKTDHNAASWLTEKALRASASKYTRTGSLDELLALPQGRERRRRHDDITIQVIFFDHNSTYPKQTPSGGRISEPAILSTHRRLPKDALGPPGAISKL